MTRYIHTISSFVRAHHNIDRIGNRKSNNSLFNTSLTLFQLSYPNMLFRVHCVFAKSNYFKMSTPNDVIRIVNAHQYGENNIEFWNMLQFLFSDYNGIRFWTQLPRDTFRKMIGQLHRSIDLLPTFDDVKRNAELIYKSYMVMMHQIRGKRSIGETMATEKTETLKSLHNVYRTLFRLSKSSIPLFGHVILEHIQ